MILATIINCHKYDYELYYATVSCTWLSTPKSPTTHGAELLALRFEHFDKSKDFLLRGKHHKRKIVTGR